MTTERNDQALDAALQRVTKTQQSTRRNTIIATLIPVALGLVFLGFTLSQVDALQDQKETLQGQVKKLEGQDLALQEKIDAKQQELTKLEQDIAVLEPWAGEALGRRPERIEGASSEILAGARAATEASVIAAGSEKERARREKLTIAQYSKSLESEVNLDVVVRSLEKFGFQIVIKPSKLQDVSTNALWFGADVQDDDVRLTALTLMGAGVDLKWISRFRKDVDFDTDKRARIHIGGWGKAEVLRPWTREEVVKIRELAGIGNPANPGYVPPE
jgi:hypothetical protein